MSSNSVCNHTCDWDIRLLLHVCLILLITCMIADRIGLQSMKINSWIKTNSWLFGRKGTTYSRHIGVLQKLSSWCTNQTAWNKSHWHFVLVSVPCAHVCGLATAFSCLVSCQYFHFSCAHGVIIIGLIQISLISIHELSLLIIMNYC